MPVDPGRGDNDDFELEPEVEALVEADDDPLVADDTRHYLQDPNHLAQFARDPDEAEQDDELDLDQTELDELGLTLDDPHQPEPE
jgi:hypothetical protein